MTTIVIDRRTGTIAADTQNTDSANVISRCAKIEKLEDGRYFMGAGHNYPIRLTKQWMETGLQPDFSIVVDDLEEYDFSCLVWGPEGVLLIDSELGPFYLRDRYFAIGAGAAYALGAMDAGATAEQAVQIACRRDPNSSEPIDVEIVEFV